MSDVSNQNETPKLTAECEYSHDGTVQISLLGDEMPTVTAWGIGYTEHQTWKCLWYSGILRSEPVAKLATVSLPPAVDSKLLTLRVEVQERHYALVPTLLPKVP
jgi:hypothetical protein